MAPYTHNTTAEEICDDLKDHIRGKVILTTGVSPGGLGAAFVENVAKYQPKLLILAGRDVSKAEQTAEAIKAVAPGVHTRVLELDLGSQQQVRKAAQEVNAYPESIDVLCNNAGVMATPYSTTKEGIESQFGMNHIGHFLFTNLIIDKILAAGPGARVVNVSSSGFRLAPIRFEDLGFEGGKQYNKWRAYGQSKTANNLFSISLAEKLCSKGLLSFSVHPGVIMTNLGRHTTVDNPNYEDLLAFDRELGYRSGWVGFPMKDKSQGCATHVCASFDPSIKDKNGGYLSDSHVLPPEEVRAWARDSVEAEMLWKVSEELVDQKFAH